MAQQNIKRTMVQVATFCTLGRGDALATYAAARAEARISSSFLIGQLRPLLGLPKEEFAVLFIVGPGRVPLALAGVL